LWISPGMVQCAHLSALCAETMRFPEPMSLLKDAESRDFAGDSLSDGPERFGAPADDNLAVTQHKGADGVVIVVSPRLVFWDRGTVNEHRRFRIPIIA
jgi:hypothetical protein